MESTRFKSLYEATNREKVNVTLPDENISEYFGENVFTIEKMRKYLSKEAYKSVKDSIDNKKKQVTDSVHVYQSPLHLDHRVARTTTGRYSYK